MHHLGPARHCPRQGSSRIKICRQSYFHLPDSIFYQTITGDWGEAAGEDGFIERDMILKPDFSTASAAPWTGDWTLQVIHDAYDRDDKPIPFSPRNVLKRVVQLYHDKGWKPVVAPEMEFFLVARKRRPSAGNRADDGPLGPSGCGASGLFDDRRGRIRPGDRRHL